MPLPSDWSRRAFLTAASTSALPQLPPTPAHPAPLADADPYAALRRRWLEISLGTGYDPAIEPYATRVAETVRLATAFRATMAPAPDRLWPEHPFQPPTGITRSYDRLWTMARAHRHSQDAGLLADTIRGLDHLAATVYHPGTTRYGNWWEWQIGSPRLLMDITALLHAHLSPDQRDAAYAAVDHFIPDTMLGAYTGTSTGANRVDLCRSVALRGILGAAPDRIALARDALSPVFPLVTEGDGLYADGSFVQHTSVAYSGTYGQVLLDGLGRLFALLAGSPWAVVDPRRQTILDSVEHAFAPLIHNGLMMDSVNGRAISRGRLRHDESRIMRGDHFHGHAMISAIALLAEGASATERERWHARIKGWIDRDTTTPILTSPQYDVADLARLHAVAAAPVPAVPEPVGHKLYPAMDRAVHRRPGWTANIAMASERISSYECGNGENPRGWHTGAGMLYWWPDQHGDGAGGAEGAEGAAQYTDWFWPTVDWYRLPGTTVSTRRLADRAGGEWGAPRPAAPWVGGTSDGEYAAIGQHLLGLGSTLEARKSWFCVADCVICLGAGISCTDGVPVETVIDNRNLGAAGTQRLTLGGGWAHLEGHGGWVFPRGQPTGGGRGAAGLRTLREDRTGAWSDINSTSSTERVTRRYQTLWFDHGTDPVRAGYAYLLMPGASRRTLTARAADRRWLTILANDASQQSVAVASLGLLAANFWQAGTVGPLTATAPASVLVRMSRQPRTPERSRGRRRTATLDLSDPPRSREPLEISWRHPVREVLHHGPGVEVLSAGRTLRVRLTGATAGESHRCEVALA
ncbi:polysaccharide lyase family 8 super-sandwich domain-containing protein [Streptomyces albipurpureus]|uniref:Polysaccharide lyase 8 family protein n=1 Tax=Streptomyces albipurpureus TaxID=2897419 RepID=A0ABT0UHA2_9ACTN|nr:polysaccharide lyase 8 family protein [Streptomyces sp. CWNU-1]MCM2387706.1 polysaccharide lyase 8 family protein [Streptomyces sp. CWNU-1]